MPKVEDLKECELEAAVKLLKDRQKSKKPRYARNPNLGAKDEKG
jgi:hypothetical protein